MKPLQCIHKHLSPSKMCEVYSSAGSIMQITMGKCHAEETGIIRMATEFCAKISHIGFLKREAARGAFSSVVESFVRCCRQFSVLRYNSHLLLYVKPRVHHADECSYRHQ